MLTHTLNLSQSPVDSVDSTIDSGPQPRVEWLLQILESLPRLQSLLVSRLPFFDHGAMLAVSAAGASHDNVHLLVAESETNATPRGIAQLLHHFPTLVYLDLSYTPPTRDVLSSLSRMAYLQVLKLRGLRLKDEDVQFLIHAICSSVRFLDLRDNQATDTSVRSLVEVLLPPPVEFDDRMDPDIRDYVKRPDLDELVMKMLTQPLTAHSRISNLPRTGITHLYLANNPITVEGVVSLLAAAAGRLFALDVGIPSTADSSGAAERLIPLLVSSHANDKLTYLRINHAVVTEDIPVGGDSTSTAGLRDLPEIINDIGPSAEGSSSGLAPPPPPPPPQVDNTSLSGSPISSADADYKRIQELLANRPSAAAEHIHLHPSHIPHVETLVLTDIPPFLPAKDPHILSALIRFITACSDEALLADLQAKSHHYYYCYYSAGHARVEAEKRRSKDLFALRRLVLELAPPSSSSSSSSSINKFRELRPGSSWKSSGDRDVDMLRSAATNDFSFFGGDQEWGDPEEEDNSNDSPRSAQQHGLVSSQSSRQEQMHQVPNEVDLVAELAAFRRAKKAQYEGCLDSNDVSSSPYYVEGYWKGEVNVVRKYAMQ